MYLSPHEFFAKYIYFGEIFCGFDLNSLKYLQTVTVNFTNSVCETNSRYVVVSSFVVFILFQSFSKR